MMAAQSSSYWCGNSLRDEWPRQYKESGPAERAEKSAEKKNARDYPLPKKIKEFALLTQREGATG